MHRVTRILALCCAASCQGLQRASPPGQPQCLLASANRRDLAKVRAASVQLGTSGSDEDVLVVGMGGTIDKDYPRTTLGYAFEIDEPAAERILDTATAIGISYAVLSICKKDSTEIVDADRDGLVEQVRTSSASRVVVTHGTDTMIETARYLLATGAAAGKAIAFTGAMKPERFKDSDASFNFGGAVAATSLLPPGSVVVCMGGNVIPASVCERDTDTGRFIQSSSLS